MRVLLAASGSHGDVLPFIAIGKELRRQGHEVRLYANPFFARHIADADLPFIPVGTADLHEQAIHHPGSQDMYRAMKIVANYFMGTVAECYRAMRRDVQPDNTIVVGSTLSFAPRLLQETMRLPSATVHYSCSLLRSCCEPARLDGPDLIRHMPATIKRLTWRTLDWLFLDPLFTRPLNQIRMELRLAPLRHIFQGWIHEADVNIAMFPAWFAPPQPDWPVNLQMVGFPLYDHGEHTQLPGEVQAFLEAGEPPVAFTAGTATAAAQRFFAASAQACRSSGRRGLLLTQYSAQLPDPLPENVANFTYVPFSALLPRVIALVHHGGIGTTSHALRAGVPQVICPVAFDQFDNARRATQLGVAREIAFKRYTAVSVMQILDQIDDAMRMQCRTTASRLTNQDAVRDAADIILGRSSLSQPRRVVDR